VKREKLHVGVTGIHLGENAQPGPGVIRSMRAALGDALHVVGLGYDALDSSLYAPGLLDDAFLLPYPSAAPSAYVERIKEIDAQVGLDVLIPCLDVELPVLLNVETELARAKIGCVLPSRRALNARRKDTLPELARALGLHTPETVTLAERELLGRAGEQLGYPFVLKGPFYEAEIVQSLPQAHAAFARLSAVWGLPLLAQRFVHGEEYNVALLGDGDGGAYGAVAMRKTIVTRLGKAWGAMTVEDPQVLSAALRVVAGLGWRGGCEVELLKEPSGKVQLIEVNPRFPAWIYLSAASGANLPLGLLELAQGRTPRGLERYRSGVFYVRHASEMIGHVRDIEGIVSAGRMSMRPSELSY